jgi:hypothetical protein
MAGMPHYSFHLMNYRTTHNPTDSTPATSIKFVQLSFTYVLFASL